ncbi:hypothetical protein EDB85DRAFT_2207826 [Lactarius pseudohatsudake]|nr:hypothetical protein EDB85DRAFT_2207826 [Lactarius pseudohatsudake]
MRPGARTTTTRPACTNTQTVSHCKGVGNTLFVFCTYGTAHLDPSHSSPSTTAPGAGSTSTSSLPLRRISPAYRRRVLSPPQHTWPEKVGGAKATRTNIDGSSSDEDDFDGGLDTRVWNRTAALPHALPPPPPPPPPHPTSRTPALAVSLTYLPAITLLASPLLVSVGMRMRLSLVVTRLSSLSPPASLLSQLRDDNGDEATVTTATMVTR